MKKKQFVNKIKNFFQKNIISVLILALIPAGIIILINPVDFKKYQIKLTHTRLNNNAVRKYIDLNNDGKEEYIDLYNFTDSPLAMMIYNSDTEHCGQYNSKYYMPLVNIGNNIYCKDINDDSVKEIIYFSQNKDSVFLSIFDYEKLDFLVKERFITTIGINNKKDYAYHWLSAVDINNDQNKEIYFSIIGGFALYPREIFRYDFVNDSLISSLNVGAKQNVNSFNNKSGEPFFLSGSRATDNCNKDLSFEYRDTCTWFFSYDKDLKFITKPKPFIGKPSSITNIYKSGENYIALFSNDGTYGSESKIVYFNMQGEIKDTAILPHKFKKETLIKIKIESKEHFFISETSTEKMVYYEFFPDVKELKKTNLSKEIAGYLRPVIFDIDKDGEGEYFLLNYSDYALYLSRNNFKHSVKVPLDSDFNNIIDVSSKVTDNVVKIIITSNTKIYFLDYFNNPNYWYQYPFFLLIYLFSILFTWIVQLIPKRISKKQDDLKNKIVNLQLKNTQNQLDPHFTFNALNVVASKIYKEDRNAAYDLFERFSRLMRSSLAFSDKIFRPLKDEIQFTEDYLEFQKSRFNNLFDYEILIPENINTDKIKIPKMLIQSFAENCVKHAFKGVDYKGKISITVIHSVRDLNPDRVNLIIEDNGIGIKQSQFENPVPKSGVGMIAMQEQVSLINKLYDKEIRIDITERSTVNPDTTGTVISIQL